MKNRNSIDPRGAQLAAGYNRWVAQRRSENPRVRLAIAPETPQRTVHMMRATVMLVSLMLQLASIPGAASNDAPPSRHS
jgi:hypothetical protein